MTTEVKSLEEEYLEESALLIRRFCEGVINGEVRKKGQAELMVKYRESVGTVRLIELNRTKLVPMISDCSKGRESGR